jgi:bifunctional DNA-binding transcriptional regulator/antitoxin component of YhaV-PrlF toxin-antitoxin module
METLVDERGRVLIPQGLRSEVGLEEGMTVTIKKEGKNALLLAASSKGRRTWEELNGLEPARTGKPKWPTPQEIKSIWG